MHDEPIWAKVGDKKYASVPDPEVSKILRFNAANEDIPATGNAAVQDCEWRVVGWVTSGGYAHYVGQSMAQGYLPAELSEITDEGMFEIEILGKRCAARIAVEPPFDPSGAQMRGV